MNKKVINSIVIVLIFIMAFGLRIYRLGEIPHGINIDEAGMAYDAFCLLHFRVDRSLNQLPVYFVNFGGGQSVLYGYLTSICIAIFGFTLKSFRLTQVIISMIACIVGYFMFKKHIDEKAAAIILLLIAINPWNIMSSRWGLDCNLLAPMMIISMSFLLRAEKWYDYILAGAALGVTLYTYVLSYIIIPLFLLFVLIYMLYTKKITIKNIIIMGAVIFVFAIPLILMILVNYGVLNQINWIITIPKLPNYRNSEISISNFVKNISRLDLLFVYDELPFNTLREYGTLYLFAIPVAFAGLIIEIYRMIKNLKEKKFEINTVFVILFIPSFIFMMFIQDVNVSKANILYYPLIFFEYSALKLLYNLQNKKIKDVEETSLKLRIIIPRVLLCILVILYVYNFASFTNYYFNQYAIDYEEQQFFEDDLVEAIKMTNGKAEYRDKKVYIYTDAREAYIYTLYANPISPYDFNATRHGDNNSYGRFEILDTKNRFVDENGVYIVRVDTDFVYELAKYYGYNYEQVDTYMIMFKQ